MKRKFGYVLIGVLAGVACDAGVPSDASLTQQIVDIQTSTDPGEITDDEFDRVIIDGMPCIVWKDRRGSQQEQYAYSGLTCDWPPS